MEVRNTSHIYTKDLEMIRKYILLWIIEAKQNVNIVYIYNVKEIKPFKN